MKIFFFFYRMLLGLRYRVVLKNEELLKHDGPILLLPNHIALVDPRILMAFLGKYIIASPVASEKYYNMPVLKQIMQSVGTVPVGEMEKGANSEDVKKMFQTVVDELGNGKNILIYPSGQIFRQGYENVKGKQSAYNIVSNMPGNTRVIGIKTRGLWGSMRSMAWDNMETGFFRLLGRSIWVSLANLIFFLPKRKVSIELQDITLDIKKKTEIGIHECNQYLEDFYNSEPELLAENLKKNEFGGYKMIDGKEIFVENTHYIKHFFFYDDVKNRIEPEVISGSINDLSSGEIYDISDVSDEIIQKIYIKISELKEVHIDEVTHEKNLILDLYFDSLDLAELKSYIQIDFEGASNPPITQLKTVGHIIIMAIGKSTAVEELKPCEWKKSGETTMLLVKKLKN